MTREHEADPVTKAEKARTAEVFNQVSSTYGEIVPFFSYFGERLVAAAHVTDGHQVLDVASGLGACLLPAARVVGHTGRVVGIDISSEMVNNLNRAIEASAVRNANARLMDAEALEFADDSFDVVTCAFAVFFFPDRVGALLEFARVLKPGGTVALSTFGDETLAYPWFADVVAPFLPEGPSPDSARLSHRRVDQHELHDQLQRVGFAVPTSDIVDGPFRFDSVDAHWEWLMSNAYRFTIERVEINQRENLRDAVAHRMEQHRDADGYRFDRPARLTIARLAGSR